MANNKYIRGLSGRGFRVKNNTGAWVTCKEGVNVQVDLDNVTTQDILSRERDNFVRVSGSSATTAVIKPLTRRGFRITPRSSTVTITEANPGVVTFTAHGLKANDAVTFTTTGTLPTNLSVNTVYYVVAAGLTVNTFRVSETPGGAAINTSGSVQSGTHTCYPVKKNVTQSSDVTVDLNDGEIKRFLKRNYGRYIVLNNPNDVMQNIYGIQDIQASFRVTDPTLTFEFPGANNNLTFVPKTTEGDVVTVQLIDPGTNETPIAVNVVNNTNIQVELDVTQNVQASLTTTLTGADNDIEWTATSAYPGTAGNAIRITYVVSGNNTPLSVAVSGTDITVNVATDESGAATSTATQVRNAVAAFAPAAALVTSANAPGNDGSGVVTDLTLTALSGGVDYNVRSTAADVKSAIEGNSSANALVTVTHEGNGSGKVAAIGPEALGLDPEGLGRSEAVNNVDLTEAFNINQLRRRFKAWVEN
jgi:hypothetical protein